MTRPGMPAPNAPGSKPKSFKPSLQRLLRRLAPERLWVFLIIVLAVISVVFNVLGPQLLGNATNLIFNGVVGAQLPAGITQQQAIDGLRADGQNQLADMLSGMTVVPGVGVDFTAVGRTLMVVIVLYLGAAVFAWMQGYLLNIVIQRTIRRLRRDIEAKIHRLPLSYFDTPAW